MSTYKDIANQNFIVVTKDFPQITLSLKELRFSNINDKELSQEEALMNYKRNVYKQYKTTLKQNKGLNIGQNFQL